jgi:hypothetical protein
MQNTIQALRYQVYQGQGDGYVTGYMDMVMRFREVLQSYLFEKVSHVLDATQLEDLDMVEGIYQHLVDSWDEVYGMINASSPISIINEKGLTERVRDASIANIGFKIKIPSSMINKLASQKYADQYITVSKCLQLQFESVAWYVIHNTTKLGGRLAQLQDPNKTSAGIAPNSKPIYDKDGNFLGNCPLSFQEDPFQNPFLLFDSEKAIYTNVADNASHTVGLPSIPAASVKFIPYLQMMKAPEILNKYTRTTSPLGIGYSPGDTGEGKSSSSILWIAAAAAAGYFLMNR